MNEVLEMDPSKSEPPKKKRKYITNMDNSINNPSRQDYSPTNANESSSLSIDTQPRKSAVSSSEHTYAKDKENGGGREFDDIETAPGPSNHQAVPVRKTFWGKR